MNYKRITAPKDTTFADAEDTNMKKMDGLLHRQQQIWLDIEELGFYQGEEADAWFLRLQNSSEFSTK